MTAQHEPKLLDVSAARRDRERHQAEESDRLNRDADRKRRRVLVQCVGLAFAWVPFYGLSMRTDNQGIAEVWSALAFAVSYAAPFFRWLVYHMHTSEEFRR